MAFIVPYAFKIAIAILKAYGVFWVSGKWEGGKRGKRGNTQIKFVPRPIPAAIRQLAETEYSPQLQ